METTNESKPHVHFAVEKVIGISSDGNYQVQWAPAWVSKFHLVGCEHLIQEFLQQQQSRIDGSSLKAPTSYSQSDETVTMELKDVNANKPNITEFHEPVERKRQKTVNTNYACSNFSTDHANISKSEDLIPTGDSETTGDEEDNFLELGQNTTSVTIKIEDEESAVINSDSKLNVMYYNEPLMEEGKDQRRVREKRSTRDSLYLFNNPLDHNTVTHELDELNDDLYDPCDTRGGKSLACDFCSRVFTKRSHLKDHIRTHTGEKPFICPVCLRAFARNCTMKLHLKKIHGGGAGGAGGGGSDGGGVGGGGDERYT